MVEAMENSMSSQRIIFLVFVVALLVRLFYLFEQSAYAVTFAIPVLDEAEMVASAERLLAGEGFGSTPLFKAPLYPAFVALFMRVFGDGWIFSLRVFQHFCGAVLVVLGAFLAGRLSGGGRRALWATGITGLILALYGPLIRLEHRLILDFMAVFLQSVLLFSLLRTSSTRGILLIGLIGGACVLNRPTILPVLPFIACWIGWRHGSWKKGVLFVLPTVCCLLAVGVRNERAAGEWMTMPWQGGYNFYEANRDGASGRYLAVSEASFADVDNPTMEFARTGYLQASGLSQMDSYQKLNQFWYQRARTDIFKAPNRWFGLMLQKSFYLLSDREIYNFEDYDVQRSLSSVLTWAAGRFGLIWPLALSGLLFCLKEPNRQSNDRLFLWGYILLLGGAIALFYTSGRMRMPLAWPIAVLAGVSCSHLLFGKLKGKALGMWVASFIVGGFLSWGDWWGVRSEATAGLEYLKLSSVTWKAGDPQKALALAEEAEKTVPSHPTLPQLKGQALFELGQFEEAEKAFKRSMELLPQDPIAPFNLASLNYYQHKDIDGALNFLEQSLKRSPTYERALLMQIRLWNLRGRSKIAKEAFSAYAEKLAGLNRDPHFDWLLTKYLLAQDDQEKNMVSQVIGQMYGEPGVEKLDTEIAFIQQL